MKKLEKKPTNLLKQNFKKEWVLKISYLLLGPISAFAKMGTVPIIIFALFGYESFTSAAKKLRLFAKSVFGKVIIIFLIWTATSMLWSAEPLIYNFLRVAVIIIVSILFFLLMNSLNPRIKVKVIGTICISFLFLLCILLIEGWTDASIHRFLRPLDSIPREGEWVPYISLIAARGTAILAPFTFLLALFIQKKTNQRKLSCTFVLLSFLATLQMPMAASSLAIFLGCLTYAFVFYKPKVILPAISMALILVALTIPFLTPIIVKEIRGSVYEKLISRNVMQRLEIWNFTSEKINGSPFVGHGFGAARSISATSINIANTNWKAMPLHPHNSFLQVWLELGLLGVLILCYYLHLLFKNIKEKVVSKSIQACLASTLISTLILSLISFGIWQYWWIATWGLLLGTSGLLLNKNINKNSGTNNKGIL